MHALCRIMHDITSNIHVEGTRRGIKQCHIILNVHTHLLEDDEVSATRLGAYT